MMHTRLAAISFMVFCLLPVQGCAWTSRMWGKLTGDAPVAKTQAQQGDASPLSGAQASQVQPMPEQPAAQVEAPAAEQQASVLAPVSEVAPAAPMAPADQLAVTRAPATAEVTPAERAQTADSAPNASQPMAETTLSGDAMFAFGKSDIANITAEGRSQLDVLATQLIAMESRLDTIAVVGHADHLGAPARIQAVSEQCHGGKALLGGSRS